MIEYLAATSWIMDDVLMLYFVDLMTVAAKIVIGKSSRLLILSWEISYVKDFLSANHDWYKV